MSDAAGKRPDAKSAVSMTKKPSATADAARGPVKAAPGAPPATVPLPPTIKWATIAAGAFIVFTLARGLLLRGYTSELTQYAINSNNKATGKNHKSPYTSADIAHDLSSLRNGALVQGVVVCLAVAFLAYGLRRPRGASGARWGLIVILILTSGPFALIPVSGFPTLPKFAGVLIGVSSIAIIVLVLLPASLKYFRACKAASRPEGAPARPGLGAMFGGGARGAAGSGRPAGRGSLFGPRPAPATEAQAPRTESANPSRPRSKAKVRVEADAVAKGAELARTRAKASKSRRTETP
ncbi:MAG: hypothetical protein ABI301_07430 [Jatrophihabitantaceae bacterium]